MHSQILHFISKFTDGGRRREVIETFTGGCCYWFARILYDNFGGLNPPWSGAEIVYDEVMNHFAFEYDGHIYDITGEITDRTENFKPWSSLDDPLLVSRIVCDSIIFLEPENVKE